MQAASPSPQPTPTPAGESMAVRVKRHDRMVWRLLLQHLGWPEAERARMNQVGAARRVVDLLCLRLSDAGFYLDGEPLERVIAAALASVGRNQQVNGITYIKPYLTAVLDGYVAKHSDRLKSFALRNGMHFTQSTELTPLVSFLGQRYKDAQIRRSRQKARARQEKASDKAQSRLIPKGTITRLQNQASHAQNRIPSPPESDPHATGV